MWQSHFVVLGERPSDSNLRRLADGYQLFQEARTGLFYLTANSGSLRRRPDFAGFLEREITHRVDVSPLERFISEAQGGLNIRKHEISFDLIQRAASLSSQLDMAVLVVEETDDEYAMAAMIDKGALAYLRFRTSLMAGMKEGALVEVTYRDGDGFNIDYRPSDNGAGLAPVAIADVFRTSRLRLFNYAEQKPSREQAKGYADQLGISIQDYLDSFGVFERVSHAPPRSSVASRMIVPIRYALSLVALPFIIASTVVLALIYSGRPQADPVVSIWRLIWLGLAILAIPVLAVVFVVRAVPGF